MEQQQAPVVKRRPGRPPRNPLHPRYVPPPRVENKPFSCRKCPDTFSTLPELKAHKKNAHPKIETQLTCELCNKTFLTPGALDKHKLLHNFLGRLADAKQILDNESSIVMRAGDISSEIEATNNSLNEQTNASSNRRDSTDSCNGESKETKQLQLNCTFCDKVCTSNVSLMNHLKRDHSRRASICQFCNGLLIDTTEVRHMLDYHIVPSKANLKTDDMDDDGAFNGAAEPSNIQEDVEELVRVLGKHRLQPLMMYHDFEGKRNNATMRCPMCPEFFANRESCRFHYVWIHDDKCLLCDKTFRSGSSACQHKVRAHTSTATYLWCIERLVTAIVNTLKLDPGQPSHVLFKMLSKKLDVEVHQEIATQQNINNSMKNTGEQSVNACHEDPATNASDRSFLEEVVLSEDQLPDAGNMIEVVIGREDSEDDLLSMLNLSPNYENNCEQRNMQKYTGGVIQEGDEDLEKPPEALLSEQMTGRSVTPPPILETTNPTTPLSPSVTMVQTPSTVPSSPIVDNNYVSSGVCKYKLDTGEEQLVLVVTDEDIGTYKDDIDTLAQKISETCDSLPIDEITRMLKDYFESVNATAATIAT